MNKNKNGLDDKTVTFIISKKYWLKKYGIPRSQWRKKIGIEYANGKIGTPDQFCPAWDYLESVGLIR